MSGNQSSGGGQRDAGDDGIIDDSSSLAALDSSVGSAPASPPSHKALATPGNAAFGWSTAFDDEGAAPGDPAADDPAAERRAEVIAQAETQLAAQQQADLAHLDALNQREAQALPWLYRHSSAPMARAMAAHTAGVEAQLPADEAEMAARVAESEEAKIAEDEAQAKHDLALVDARAPGSALAAEAGAVVAEIDHDRDDAMSEAIEARMVEAQAARDHKQHDPASAWADSRRAEELLAKASADLADADGALAKLEADMRAGGQAPPGA